MACRDRGWLMLLLLVVAEGGMGDGYRRIVGLWECARDEPPP